MEPRFVLGPWPRLTPLAVLLVAASAAGAQCPDGSPPPCRTRAALAAPAPNPPLDDRTWIVMPFDNLSNSAEIDWLRNASVNLLYLDMSRWQDIRVVDDERVADFLRDVAPARTGAPTSLTTALALARRAGAGKLVMGDLLKAGNRTMVTAKVFDVRRGERLHTVRDETTVADSVIPLFGRLAQRILRVEPPASARVGMIGTSSVDAYRAYLRGVQALHRFDLGTARTALREALRLDSTFALAHYKLATTLGWEEMNDPTRPMHAEASLRFSTSLPQRERSLIEAQAWHIRGDQARACAIYKRVVAADSSDVDAWHGLGECSFHDEELERLPGDTTRARFRGDWNLAIRAFHRVLALDPTYHVAYPHLVDMLAYGGRRRGCMRDANNPCASIYQATVRLSGDSLLVEPVRIPDDSALLRSHTDEAIRAGTNKRLLLRADTLTINWVGAAPAEVHAIFARTRVLGALGRNAEAESLLRTAVPQGGMQALAIFTGRIDLAMKRADFREARRIYDSVHAVPPEQQLRSGMWAGIGRMDVTLDDLLAATYGWTFGHFGRGERWLVGMSVPAPTPTVLRYRRAFARLMAGFPDSTALAERAVFEDNLGRFGPTRATRAIAATLAFGLRAPRQGWPALDTTLRDLRLRPVLAMLRADIPALRDAARALDSTSRMLTNAYLADTALAVAAAEAYLAGHDSASALRTVRRVLDSTMTTSELSASIAASGTVLYVAILPRVMLLRADLAAAAGQKEEARLWYRRFLDLWSTADPELQPIVQRAKQAHAAMSAP